MNNEEAPKLTVEERVAKIEGWIDQWESYDSGWNQYRNRGGQVSDGYHTFDELYEHRIWLFINLINVVDGGWKSRKHSDGSALSGWFIAGIGTANGKQITYHLPDKVWDAVKVETLDAAPEFDGHTSQDVVERLRNL